MLVHKNPYFLVNCIKGYYSIEFLLKQVIILPIVDNEFFLFVKAKRHLLDHSTIEFPSGSVNYNETIKNGALRELSEETGIEIRSKKRLVKKKSLSIMPSRISEKINIFEINLSMEEFNSRNKHDDEIDGVFIETFSNAKKLVNSGEIIVMGTISLIFSYLNNIINKRSNNYGSR